MSAEFWEVRLSYKVHIEYWNHTPAERQLLQRVVLGILVMCTQKIVSSSIHSTMYQIKSRRVEDIYIKTETLYLLEHKMDKCLKDIGTGKEYPNKTSITQEIKSIIKNYNYIKLKFSLYIAKKITNHEETAYTIRKCSCQPLFKQTITTLNI